MKSTIRVVSPYRESAFGKALEVHGRHFAVLRMPGIDRGDAGLFNQIQAKVGLPLLVLAPDQELELCEVSDDAPIGDGCVECGNDYARGYCPHEASG